MRTTSLVLLSLTTASLAVASPSPDSTSEGGSIEALLERISQRNNHTTAAGSRVSGVPDAPKNGTHVPPTPPPAKPELEQPVAKNGTEAVPPKEGGKPEAHKHESKRSVHGKMAKRVRAKAEEENAKRWVWATGIIQDDTPSSAVPPVGGNANLLSSNAAPVNTPAAVPVAPSFPPVAAPSPATTTTTPAAPRSTPKRTWYKAQRDLSERDLAEHDEEKRWVWSNSVIQDDSSSSDLPPIGQNVDLRNGASGANTPAATLVAPSFPPRSSQTPGPSSSSEAATGVSVFTTSTAHVADNAVVSTPAAATIVTAAPAAQSTSPVHWWNPKHMLEELEDGFEKLFHLGSHASATTNTVAAESTATPAQNEKRYVWSNQIIPDDTPNAPAVGENANLLSSPAAYGATTPAAALVAPSFPPVAAPSSSAPAALAAAAPAAETTAVVRNARVSWKEAHEAALAAAAAKKAAAQTTTTTTTTTSAKATQTSTAAQKWFKAEPKAKRMVKRERK
ncbi:hypothetical protein JCM10207_008875 [Rhodosporidiobolus poonsookiae]